MKKEAKKRIVEKKLLNRRLVFKDFKNPNWIWLKSNS